MLLPVVARPTWAANKPLLPMLRRLDMVFYSICGWRRGSAVQRALDDAGQLAGVVRIGGVAGLLQALGEAAGVARAGQHLLVARIAGQQLGVVFEAVAVVVVGAEALDLGLRLAVDVLGGGGLDHLALPVAAGLDAEQVVAVAAVAALDLALAPAALQRRLAQHELGRDAGGAAGFLGVRAELLLEAAHVRRLAALVNGGGCAGGRNSAVVVNRARRAVAAGAAGRDRKSTRLN